MNKFEFAEKLAIEIIKSEVLGVTSISCVEDDASVSVSIKKGSKTKRFLIEIKEM